MPRHKKTAPPELKTLPGRVTYARERLGMTMTELATQLDVPLSTMSRLESGERIDGIEAATLIRLARALGVPVGWLAANEGAPPATDIPVFREPPKRRR